MKTILTQLTEYHHWATAKVCDWMLLCTPEQLQQHQISSFNNLITTITHMANAEYNWLQRVAGNSVWQEGVTTHTDPSTIQQFWLQQSSNWIAFVKNNDITGLMQPLVYQNLKGETFQTELYKVVMHVMNHATYHRGQLVTMFRNVGFTDVSSTDFITYARL